MEIDFWTKDALRAGIKYKDIIKFAVEGTIVEEYYTATILRHCRIRDNI